MVTTNSIAFETKKSLTDYRNEVSDEVASILNYWMSYTLDNKLEGFYGSVSNNNQPALSSPKGIVLNSRILWAFSASFLKTKNKEYLAIAVRAYQYILDYFIDTEYGGVYWSVDAGGKILDGKKQIYGLAFCIYGVSEYYKATPNETALKVAIKLFNDIERYSFDRSNGGYFEAFSRAWEPVHDLRLSEKDANEKKTMNTHLHVIEAYANLYQVWPDEQLRYKIKELLKVFEKYIIDAGTYHLNLFLDEKWNVRSSIHSYGHDIEAAWLLLESAEIIKDPYYIDHFKDLAIKITDSASEGLDADGGLWYEYEVAKDRLIKEKHWWPQAEAMVGFFNAYQLSGNKKYLHHSLNSWAFIKKYIRDKNGEWFWGVFEDYTVMQKDKAGFWKCPYHNTRACLEIINRIHL